MGRRGWRGREQGGRDPYLIWGPASSPVWSTHPVGGAGTRGLLGGVLVAFPLPCTYPGLGRGEELCSMGCLEDQPDVRHKMLCPHITELFTKDRLT